ncbi:MAG: DUF2630 family protein [Actinomycetota bacterium]|nr:DUF2630 family protein [Actinomycetota bacterium]
MDDTEIVRRIDELVEEEHRLERSHIDEPMSTSDQERLQSVEEQLDQCWDLLRRRRARRSAGGDPDDVETRPVDTVERYRQ